MSDTATAVTAKFARLGQPENQSASAFMLAVAQGGRMASRIIKKAQPALVLAALTGEESGVVEACETFQESIRILNEIAKVDPSLTCHIPSGDRADPSYSYGPAALLDIVSGKELKRTKAFDRSCLAD